MTYDQNAGPAWHSSSNCDSHSDSKPSLSCSFVAGWNMMFMSDYAKALTQLDSPCSRQGGGGVEIHKTVCNLSYNIESQCHHHRHHHHRNSHINARACHLQMLFSTPHSLLPLLLSCCPPSALFLLSFCPLSALLLPSFCPPSACTANA